MAKKNDKLLVLIVAIIVVLSSLVLYFTNKNSTPTGEVEIYVNGNLYKTAKIVEGERIVLNRGLMSNTILFTKNGVKMEHSNCNNQLCVMQGEINFDNYKDRALGNSIICLPNRITIKLVLKDDNSETNDF